ncbi:MAG: hypothetical protein NZM04_01800, partial [Methylacidiphilales bacterium]|nr:hypothetical protein [Candidatus Methylacidiphilales bacterium]
TLNGICKAIENIKSETGEYPESIENIDGARYVDEDYSDSVTRKIIYLKTSNGYVMFLPYQGGCHVQSDQGCHVKILK